MKGRQKAIFSFLFFIAFFQLNLCTNHFSLLTLESLKPSLPLFLTIEGKRLSFSLSAQFEQLNTAKNLAFSNSYFFFILLLSFTLYLLTRYLLDPCF